MTAYLAGSQPDFALQLQPTNATALLNLAEDKLERDEAEQKSSAASPASAKLDYEALTDIRSWAKRALRNDPLNARAFRILGQLAQRDADDKNTKIFMQAAARRSLHESAAVYAMMVQSYQDQDYDAAIRYADVLLRTLQDLSGVTQPVVSVLAKIAETKEGSGKVAELLAGNPPWRSRFFGSFSNSISDARTPLQIFLVLRNTPGATTAEDRSPYLDFLVGHGFYELAYYAWLQFLPPEQLSKLGRLVNGNFEADPTGAPFDWQFSKNPGVTIEVIARPAGEGEGKALFIKFGAGRVDFGGVSQLIILPPGSYEFRGKQKADLVSRMGLRWHIRCAGKSDEEVGQSPVVNGTDMRWADFAFSLTVPATDCPAQYIRLASEARSASEQFISGSVWFDDLEIVRKPTLNP
jgi:hypothetical protein